MKKFTQVYIKPPDWIKKEVYKNIVDDVLKLALQTTNKPTKKLVVLDVGSSYGFISFELAKRAKRVVGIEPYLPTYSYAVKNNKYANVKFYNKKIENFKTSTKFDLVFSLTTLEHMPQANASFKRIFALLKDGGIIYMTAPNRLWPYDCHYKLPFIMWLPLNVADLYVRIMKRGKDFRDAAYAKTYFGIKKFLNQFPCTYEFIIPNPRASYLGCGKTSKQETKLRNLGIKLLKLFPFMWIFSKGFIILIQKKRK